MIVQGLKPSILGRAAERNLISLDAVDIREYTMDKHGKVDDYPYGGGAGMLMQAQPVFDAHRAVTGGRPVRTIYVTPQGEPFTQRKARELAGEEELVFLCGHYEGIDERVLEEVATDYLSVGDYVLTGGELPAMVMIDAIARLVPGVLGNDSSAEEESFYRDLLEYPQYSRPEVWHGKEVPGVLLSGDHAKVAEWRLEQSMRRTADRRPDLYAKYQAVQALIGRLSRDKRNHIHMMESLAGGSGEVLYDGYPAEEKDVLIYDRECGICMLTAGDRDSGGKLADRIPPQASLVLTSQDFMEELLAGRQYRISRRCALMLYTQRTALPMKHKNIRQLTPDMAAAAENLLAAGGHTVEDGRDPGGIDIRGRIQAGAVYGLFAEETLAGFAGINRDKSLGLLYVAPSFRRQGYGSALAACTANRMLEKGRTPCGYIPEENAAAERLLKNLGFYKASRMVGFYERTEAYRPY